jgi:hypothetical protein
MRGVASWGILRRSWRSCQSEAEGVFGVIAAVMLAKVLREAAWRAAGPSATARGEGGRRPGRPLNDGSRSWGRPGAGGARMSRKAGRGGLGGSVQSERRDVLDLVLCALFYY